jgi:hypothetical protein
MPLKEENPMELSQKHHANIIMAFYMGLKERCGERGLNIFLKAEQTYGERRGRRMSLRALRDGNPLDYKAYFAYGELPNSPETVDVSLAVEPGQVHEVVCSCLWADSFITADCIQCGIDYCHEIDAAVVRGFNPYLDYELTGNIYTKGQCDFFYRSKNITENILDISKNGLLPGTFKKRDLNYHCADVYFAYVMTVKAVLEEKESSELIQYVRTALLNIYGQQILDMLDMQSDTDFFTID